MALTRLLVAVLQSALRGPQDEDAQRALLHDAAGSAPLVLEYLDRWRHRFDLFDPELPFLQVTAAQAAKKHTPAILRLDWASGNNVTLFDHHVDAKPVALTPSEAARALLVTLHYSRSAGKSATFHTRDAPGARPVTALVEGANLWESLVLNSWAVPDLRADAPAWERDSLREAPPSPAGRPATGWLDRLTWRSRGVLLVRVPRAWCTECTCNSTTGWTIRTSRTPGYPFRWIQRRQLCRFCELTKKRALWRSADALLAGLRFDAGGLVRETVVSRAVLLLADEEPPRFPQVFFSGLLLSGDAKIGDAAAVRMPVSRALLDDSEGSHRDWVDWALGRAGHGEQAVRHAVRV